MARTENRKYHYIYKTTCNVNKTFYIGMHSTDNLQDRYKGSGKRLWYSIRKYGIENHITEILEFLPSRKELKEREFQIVNQELLEDPSCLNLRQGGEGGGGFGHLSKEQKEYTYQRAGEASKRFHEELKKDPVRHKAWQEKQSKLWKEMTRSGKVTPPCNYGTAFLGRNHSQETKEKMSQSQQGKQVGEKNSQFGTCWVYNSETLVSQKINASDLDQWLEAGWIKGRKLKAKE